MFFHSCFTVLAHCLACTALTLPASCLLMYCSNNLLLLRYLIEEDESAPSHFCSTVLAHFLVCAGCICASSVFFCSQRFLPLLTAFSCCETCFRTNHFRQSKECVSYNCQHVGDSEQTSRFYRTEKVNFFGLKTVIFGIEHVQSFLRSNNTYSKLITGITAMIYLMCKYLFRLLRLLFTFLCTICATAHVLQLTVHLHYLHHVCLCTVLTFCFYSRI